MMRSVPRMSRPRACAFSTSSLRSRFAPPSAKAPTRPPTAPKAAPVVVPKAYEPAALSQVTTLTNGVRVASEALPDAFAGVGVYIDAGSRYENAYLSGTSHIMDRLAFKSTTKRSAVEMLETLESLGGNINCASSRESMMYQASTFNSAIPTATELLAETIREPLLTDEEVAQQLDTAAYEIKAIWAKPELILPELVHTAAFKDNTLGNPLLCPEERLGEINADVIRAYRQAFYRPDRIVVAFAGLSHAESVALAEQYFGDMTAPAEEDVAAPVPGSEKPVGLFSKLLGAKPTTPPASAAEIASAAGQSARYTGGFLALPIQPLSMIPTQPNLSHIQLAFEGLPVSSDDIYALATLQMLLGGGGSFSAGGPGKGMYSRLYTNVLNQFGWVESCMAFNHTYNDSGLFGIAASCLPGQTARMLEVMCRELRCLAMEGGFGALEQVEVTRAKNQLRSSLLMNLESRIVGLEDLGRQVQIHGHKIPVQEMVERINALTIADLRRVARMVVQGMVQNPGQGSGAPTVVLQEAQGLGTTAKQLQWDEIQDIIAKWQLGRS